MSTLVKPSTSLKHLAIIMDGNNRWAKEHNLPGSSGHKAGIERLRDMLDGCREHNVEVLTVFAFSSENWHRPTKEVHSLMSLFYYYLTHEAKKLQKENIQLQILGRRDRFDKKLQSALKKAEETTANGERRLVIAVDYGGRWDIANAAKKLAQQVAEGSLLLDDINEDCLNAFISLAELPPLDLLIRTGGEYRISNFLLWQAAYAELYFSDVLWPDFDRAQLDKAVASFDRRQRRFGLREAQLPKTEVFSRA